MNGKLNTVVRNQIILDGLLADRGRPDAELAPPLRFKAFVEGAWELLEPGTPYKENWHIDAICEHLEYVKRGDIKRLLINIPFRCMKSLLVSVFWPTWVWTDKPEYRFLFSSYAQKLATRDALKSRRVIQSSWYQRQWGYKFRLTSDQNEKMRYENDKTGYRVSTSVGGVGTGEGGDALVWDDPHNADDVHSDVIREGDLDWWSQVWSTRKNNPKKSVEVGVMQRLHERDLTGYILEEVGGYEHLCLPMRYEGDNKCVLSTGWEDPRKKERELLWPERFGEEEVAEAEKRLGTYGTAGQLQQRPAPEAGGIFKKHWWRFWHPAGENPLPVRVRMADGEWFECGQMELPIRFDMNVQSWDMAFKDTDDSSYVVGQVWSRWKGNAFLRDQDRDRMDLPKTCGAVAALSQRWPETTAKWVEDKANGPAVIQTLKRRIPGLVGVNPQGDKAARARAVSPYVESGNVYLPHPALFPWVKILLDEVAKFPNGRHDDQVDAMTQALIRLLTIGGKDRKAIWEINLNAA